MTYLRSITALAGIAEKDRLMASCLDHAGEAILTTDIHGIINYVNPAFCRITGYESFEVLGKKPNLLRSTRHSKHFYENLWKQILAGKVWRGEVTNIRKDKSVYEVKLTIAPVFDEDRKIKGFVAIQNDVSDYRKLLAKLEECNRDLKAFAAVASHDLKSPIGMIMSLSDLLLESASEKLSPDELGILQRIEKQTKHSLKLIKDLLDYTKLETLDFGEETTDMNVVVQVVRENLDVEIRRRKGIIEICPLPKLKGSQSQYQQLFNNLIGNAIKYQPHGQRPIVVISHEELEDEQLIRVKDNGIGFDANKCTEVFEPFKRLHRDDEYEGSGIGLAICMRIVNKLGGNISVESQPGVGSTFSITLPKLGGGK